MTTTPDPQTVRETAQEVANIALHDAVHVDRWISAVINGRFGDECKLYRSALHTAVARRMAVVKPSWPDEQPQDERDGDVRAVAPELRQEFGVQAEHSTSAFSTRTKQAARKLAATYSRVREPGCKPTPHHAVTRFSSDWQRLPDEAGVELDAREAKAGE